LDTNCLSVTGDTIERVKICKQYLKIFSRTNGPNSIKLGTSYPWLKRIQVVQIKGKFLSKWEIITKNVKRG
jgi:hypothetical protein